MNFREIMLYTWEIDDVVQIASVRNTHITYVHSSIVILIG